jgi:hypothetical protein
MVRRLLIVVVLFVVSNIVYGQKTDSVQVYPPDSLQINPSDSVRVYYPDSILRIINLNPFFTLHVDSSLSYQLQINKDPGNYFWYLKNSPIGLRINKDNGLLSFKAEKAYFYRANLSTMLITKCL